MKIISVCNLSPLSIDKAAVERQIASYCYSTCFASIVLCQFYFNDISISGGAYYLISRSLGPEFGKFIYCKSNVRELGAHALNRYLITVSLC